MVNDNYAVDSYKRTDNETDDKTILRYTTDNEEKNKLELMAGTTPEGTNERVGEGEGKK